MGISTKVGADSVAVFYPPSGDYPNYSGIACWIGLIQDITFDQDEGRTPIRYVGGGLGDRNLDMFLDQAANYTGRIRYYPQDGRLWTFAVGSISTASGSVFTITETGGRVYWGGLELYSGRSNTNTGFVRKVCGVNFDRIRLSGREGEPLECELEFVAGSTTVNRAYSSATITAGSAETKIPFMWSNVEVKISGIPWNDSLKAVKEFTWEMNNNMEHPFYLNLSRWKGESIPAAREYSCDLTMNMVETSGDSLYADYYTSGTAFDATLYAWRVSGTLGAEYLQINMSGCKMTAMNITMPNEGVVEQTCTFIPENCSFKIVDSGTAIRGYPDWSLAK